MTYSRDGGVVTLGSHWDLVAASTLWGTGARVHGSLARDKAPLEKK